MTEPPRRPAPEIVAVVVAWNGAATIGDCLRSLGDPGAPSMEVVVADNGSSDGTAALAESWFPEVRVVRNRSNLGFAAACNRVLREVRSPFVLLLNQDAALRPGALAVLRDALEARPAAVAAGPALLDGDGSPLRTSFRLPRVRDVALDALFLDRLLPPRRAPGGPVRVEFLQGSCLLLRRAAFDALGPFDEGYFLYYEEADWFRRAAASGAEVLWCPAAAAVHRGPGVPGHYDEHRLVHLHRSLFRYHAGAGPVRRAGLRLLVALRALVRIGAGSAAWLVLPGRRARAASSVRGHVRVLAMAARGGAG